MTFIPDQARTLTEGERYDGDTETFIADTLTSGSHPASNMPGRRREDDTNLAVAYHFRTRENGSCFEETDVNVSRASVGGTGGAKLAMHTAEGVRRLTPVECERLQGFPDGWTAYGPDSRRYAALGDAVTVPVAEWIGRRLLEAS
jgi:DNA (cytosine-5)-methyltransferase 1